MAHCALQLTATISCPELLTANHFLSILINQGLKRVWGSEGGGK